MSPVLLVFLPRHSNPEGVMVRIQRYGPEVAFLEAFAGRILVLHRPLGYTVDREKELPFDGVSA